ncbi:hypothetical protein MM300_21200 [Evansella sp. LMS18]|uniref:hypothetical protein n=1 Tax=Evansella sp. LMS18 TaxID=2924033 RepID=UPI0020D11261|nr:hypothetical protein [Evansella sp. LMS18]UTR10356.1 hypothetical protein MM300_21200 [Evansella sp. LMS18]
MFSNKQLKELIAGKIVGSKYPDDTKNEQEISGNIRRLFYRIKRIPGLVCEAEWDHFGSGYASFVEFFCYRKMDVSVVKEKYGMKETKTKGIIINICRHAPVAIMGEDNRYQTIRIETKEVVGGVHSSLEHPHQLVISEHLQGMAEQLERLLKEFGYELLDGEQLNQPLPFQTKIPTLYRKPEHYLIMDAIFYWED